MINLSKSITYICQFQKKYKQIFFWFLVRGLLKVGASRVFMVKSLWTIRLGKINLRFTKYMLGHPITHVYISTYLRNSWNCFVSYCIKPANAKLIKIQRRIFRNAETGTSYRTLKSSSEDLLDKLGNNTKDDNSLRLRHFIVTVI